MEMTLREIAELVGGELLRESDGDFLVRGIARVQEAGPAEIATVYDQEKLADADQRPVGALLLPRSLKATRKPAIQVDHPRLAQTLVLERFAPPPSAPVGIQASACVSPEAQLGEEVSIGPGVVIEAGAVIEARAVLRAGVYVGRNVRVGEETVLHPRVTLYEGVQVGARVIIHSGAVIGADGFGYVFHENRHRKIPQLGTVVIEDEVEIGANTTIDRATMGATRIGAGTKIDNLVQVAHNVEIGEKCVICAQTGIAGSTKIGHGVVIGGQVGIADHLTIGDGAKIGAQAGVTTDVPPGAFFSGYPARPHFEQMRNYAALRKVPNLIKTVHALARKVETLMGASPGANQEEEGTTS